jgi:hypothetical protein
MADRAGNPHIQRVESKFGISAAENAELRRQNAEVRPYCLSHGQDGQTRTSIERRDLSRGQPSLCSSVSVRLVRGYQFFFCLHKARRDEWRDVRTTKQVQQVFSRPCRLSTKSTKSTKKCKKIQKKASSVFVPSRLRGCILGCGQIALARFRADTLTRIT